MFRRWSLEAWSLVRPKILATDRSVCYLQTLQLYERGRVQHSNMTDGLHERGSRTHSACSLTQWYHSFLTGQIPEIADVPKKKRLVPSRGSKLSPRIIKAEDQVRSSSSHSFCVSRHKWALNNDVEGTCALLAHLQQYLDDPGTGLHS